MQNSNEYQACKKVNEQNAKTRSFLNSFTYHNKYNNINDTLSNLIIKNNIKPDFYFDSVYFKNDLEVFTDFNEHFTKNL